MLLKSEFLSPLFEGLLSSGKPMRIHWLQIPLLIIFALMQKANIPLAIFYIFQWQEALQAGKVMIKVT